nr:MAG TPA: hypothetical protein [Caudoviricetes sp.]
MKLEKLIIKSIKQADLTGKGELAQRDGDHYRVDLGNGMVYEAKPATGKFGGKWFVFKFTDEMAKSGYCRLIADTIKQTSQFGGVDRASIHWGVDPERLG